MIALKFDGAYDLEQWMVRIRERPVGVCSGCGGEATR